MRLYSYFRSSSAYRVRLALNIKALEYEIIPKHLLNNGGEQLTEDYGNINPMQQLPSLDIDGKILTQSMAICLFLEDAHPQAPLLSKDPLVKAAQIAFCEIINSGIQPYQNLSVLKKLDEDYSIGTDGKKKWAQHFIYKAFDALEKSLRATSGKYCFGDELSLGDCFLIPQVFSARRFSVDMNRYPIITAICNECEKLDAFIKASPENQPDFEA